LNDGDGTGTTIKVTSGAEGVFFTSNGGKGVMNNYGNFYSRIVQKDPSTSETRIEADSAYGIFMNMGDISPGQTEVALAAYAAGPIEALADVGVALVTTLAEAVSSVSATDEAAVFAFGTPLLGVSGSFYKLCWAAEPRDLRDFKITIDSTGELVGPSVAAFGDSNAPVFDDVQRFDCTLGLSCSMTFNGYGPTSTNRILVLESGECGSADAVVASWGEADTQDVSGSIGSRARRALSTARAVPRMHSHRLSGRGLSESTYDFGSNNLRFGDAAASPINSLDTNGDLSSRSIGTGQNGGS
jgi:hypothetical protein